MHLDYVDLAVNLLALCGGVSLILHEGVPRLVGFVMGFVLRHPTGRAACLRWEPELLQAIQDARDEVKRDVDAIRVVPSDTASPPSA